MGDYPYSKKRVSDIISIEDIKKWVPGDLISIQAGTGAGKSYLIKNLLYARAKMEKKKILYLVNRTRLLQQFQKEIDSEGKKENIDLMLYQSLQQSILYGHSTDFLHQYAYIVCDEFHYFFTDASFNKTTDLSMKMILECHAQIRIFMSATSQFVLDYFEQHKKLKLKKYEIRNSFSHIEKLIFFNSDDTIKKFLFELPKEDKIIYFCHSAEKAYNLSQQFEDSLFICSENNSKFRSYLDNKKILEMLINEKFAERFLFTTHTLDNGVNINDYSVKNIIVDIEDFDVLVQCIGRKRLKANESINVFIKVLSKKSLGGKITQLKNKISMSNYLLKTNAVEFIAKFPRQAYGDMIYDIANEDGTITKKVNEIMYFKSAYDLLIFSNLLKTKDGYEQYVANLLGKQEFGLLEREYDALTVEDIFNSYLGKKLFKEEQLRLKNYIEENLLTTPKGSKNSIGLETINEFLKENNYHFSIKSEKENMRNENRGKRYWIVDKINN